MVAGPIVLVLSVDDGNHFARIAAAGAVLGIVSLVAFCVAYAFAARRRSTAVALAAGWAAFALGTFVFLPVHPPLAASMLITVGSILAGAWILHRQAGLVAPAVPPGGDLLQWRLLITAVLVLALTSVARGLPAHVAGLLTPFPIITAVMAGFTHVRGGAPAATALLAGLVLALISFLAFFGILATMLGRAAPPVAYASATAGALIASALVLWRGAPELRAATPPAAA